MDLAVLHRLMELNVLIPVMVHDRVTINCGLCIQYRAKPTSGCLSVFRLQPQANLQAKQWNKIRKNGFSARIFSENI